MSTVEPGALVIFSRQVLAQAVVGHAALNGHAEVRHVLLDELDRVVLAGPDRLGEVLADLSASMSKAAENSMSPTW